MKHFLVALLLAASAAASAAETPAPCTGFAWPMTAEIAAAGAAPGAAAPPGTTLGAWPEGAITLALAPGGEKAFPLAPERAPKDGAASGYIALPAPPAPGVYQVSLGGKAWIDAVQDGKALKSGAHASDASCTLIRKSVRFDLVAAPVTLQISGSDATSIVVTIMPASD